MQDKRTVWYKDGAISLAAGMFFGAANTMTGHPLDTVKTKMQAQKGHMKLDRIKGPGVVDTIKRIWTNEGAIGFYRGCWPPLFGSVLYRGIQFSVYEGFFTKFESNESMNKIVPGLGV